jgi:hypothetical protein
VVYVKSVSVEAKSIDSDGVALSNLSIDGVRARADRNHNGRLRFAGIEIVSPVASTQPTIVAATNSKQAATARAVGGSPFAVTLDAFTLKNLEASFGDAALDKPVALSLFVDELATQQINRNPNGRVTIPIIGKLRAPRIAETIAIRGELQPFEQPYGLSVTLDAQQIKPDAIAPYLDLFGLTSTLDNARFSGALAANLRTTETGGIKAGLNLTDLVLEDATTRLAMPRMRLDEVQIEPANSSIVVNDVEMVGPELSASRESGGVLSGVGLRYQPVASANPIVPTTKPTTQLVSLPAMPKLPRIELKRVKWTGARIELRDGAIEPPRVFTLSDLGANLENIVIDLSERPGEEPAGTINGWLSLPGMANRLDVIGTLGRVPNGADLNVTVSGSGLNTSDLAPYLAPLNVEPLLTNGSVGLKLRLNVKVANEKASADISLDDLFLREGDRDLARVKRIAIARIGIEAGALVSRSISVESPSISASRGEDGSLEALGVRLKPAKVKTAAAEIDGPVLPVPYSPIGICVDELKLTDLNARFDDAAARDPVTLVIKLDASVSKVGLSVPGDPASFEASGSIDGVARRFQATGSVDLDPGGVMVAAHVQASGLTGTAINGYLPAGSIVDLRDATFAVDAIASLLPVGETGQSLSLAAKDLKLTRGEAVLAYVPVLTLDVPLIDLVKNEIDIRSLAVKGAAIDTVRVRNDGTIELPGLILGPPPAGEPAPVELASITVAADSASGGDQLAQRLAAGRKPLPFVKIQTLDLGVEQAGAWLEARGNAAPLSLKNLRLTNSAPITIGGANAADLPPVQLQIQTELSPVAKNVQIDLTAAPFASEATLVGSLRATGISGDGLLALVPELATGIDGSSLVDGTFAGSLDSKLRVARRTPTDLDLRRGFDGEIRFSDVYYRASPDGEPLAGVESITLEGIRVQPAFGGGTIKLMTVSKPVARVLRDAKGIHVLGLTIKVPSAAESTSQPAEPTSGEKPAERSVAPATPTAEPGPEFKIDQLVVSGSDVLIRDVSVEPALVIPVNALDVEVKGLSNRAFVQDRTIRFSALVGTDKVELPTRAKRGQPAGSPTEERLLLSQVTASGALKLYPAMDGYVKAAVNGFEMQSLAGEAKAFGITVGDGIFDGNVDARFRDGGNLDLKTKLVVTDLKLSEQPNGVLQRTFKLPAPLDAAIGFAEDASGSITFPVSAKIRGGEVNLGSAIGSVIGGVGQVFVTAIASAPAKLLQGVFGTEAKAEQPSPPVVLGFLPGDTSLETPLRASLDEVAAAMRKDPNLVVTLSHRFSAADASRASERASPTREQIDQMTVELRARRVRLFTDRSIKGADFSAQIASGTVQPPEIVELRELDRQIVANDDALDRLLDQTRPGAELQVERRMKAAAIDVANARLQRVKAYLDAAKVERGSERVSVVNPRFEVDDTLAEGGIVTIETVSRKRAK